MKSLASLFFLIFASPSVVFAKEIGSSNTESVVVLASLVLIGMLIGLHFYRGSMRRQAVKESDSFLDTRYKPSEDSHKDLRTGAHLQELDEVDPISEADVYLAYGRDLQAEAILKEGLEKEGNAVRRAIYLTRLKAIYEKRNDMESVANTEAQLQELSDVLTTAEPKEAQETVTHLDHNDVISLGLIASLKILTHEWKTGETRYTIEITDGDGKIIRRKVRISTEE